MDCAFCVLTKALHDERAIVLPATVQVTGTLVCQGHAPYALAATGLHEAANFRELQLLPEQQPAG